MPSDSNIPPECPVSVKNVTKAVQKSTSFFGRSMLVNAIVSAIVSGGVAALIKFDILHVNGGLKSQIFLGVILTFFILCGISVFSNGNNKEEHTGKAGDKNKVEMNDQNKKFDVILPPVGTGGNVTGVVCGFRCLFLM